MKVFVKKTQRILDDFFKIDRAVIQYEKFDGKISKEIVRLNLDRGDSVAALLINRVKQTLILIKQFRYPVYTKEKNNAWVLEIVAGMVEEGKSPEETIIREIAEETGYQVSKVNQLFYFYPTPGGSNEKVYLYSISLFNNRIHALKPYFLQSFSAAIAPIIASMATIGLVSLPGMMTGQILAGSPPMEAVKYQILIMFLIAGGTGLGTISAAWMGARRLFDERHRLCLDRLRKNKTTC